MQDVALSPIRNAFIFLPAKWVKFLALSAHMSLGRFFWNKGCELGLKMHNQDEHIITNDSPFFPTASVSMESRCSLHWYFHFLV